MKSNKVTIEGPDGPITINADWAAGLSENDFVKHEAHHGLSKDQLKEAHKLCKQAVKPSTEQPTDQLPS